MRLTEWQRRPLVREANFLAAGVVAADAAGVLFVTHRPAPPLDRFVDWFWFYEGLTTDHPLERVLPDGSMELIINLRDETRHVFDRQSYRPIRDFRRSWWSGAHSDFIVIDTAPNASMIGVHFKPGGAAAFLRVPAHELGNAVVDGEALWPGAAGLAREQLLAAPSPAARFQILEGVLRAHWRGLESGHPAVRYALSRFILEPHALTIGSVTSELGLTPRQFIQVFAEEVGLTPKRFCRVRRFQRALGQIPRAGAVLWADVAAGCGYYDQSHFVHDFREFCGLTPIELLGERIEYPNFVPITR